MRPRVPDEIKPLLAEFTTLMDAELSGYMTALYLHGSIALDAFDPTWSDIDFVAVVSRFATEDEVNRLTVVHQKIADKYPRWQLQGSYLQADQLGQVDGSVTPYPHYSDGKLSVRQDSEENGVTWWLLKNHGVAVTGADPKTLDFTVDWDKLIADMHHNLNTYWASYTQNPSRIAWLLFDYGIQWTVLGVLRQFYSFREHEITSKVGAGEYALEHLPVQWHRIIQEALNIRNRANKPLYKSRIVRAVEAFRFLRFIIRLCNADGRAT